MSTTRKIEGFVNRQAAEQWEAYGNLSFGRQSRPMLHDAPSVIIIGSGDTAPRVFTEEEVKAMLDRIGELEREVHRLQCQISGPPIPREGLTVKPVPPTSN